MRRALLVLLPLLLGCPQPKPTPPPPEPPSGSCCVDPLPSEGWAKVARLDPYNALFLNEAESVIGPVCDLPMQDSLDRLREKLSERGICSGSYGNGIRVARPDGYWEEWAVLKIQSGCWNVLVGDAYIGTWRAPSLGCK